MCWSIREGKDPVARIAWKRQVVGDAMVPTYSLVLYFPLLLSKTTGVDGKGARL